MTSSRYPSRRPNVETRLAKKMKLAAIEASAEKQATGSSAAAVGNHMAESAGHEKADKEGNPLHVIVSQAGKVADVEQSAETGSRALVHDPADKSNNPDNSDNNTNDTAVGNDASTDSKSLVKYENAVHDDNVVQQIPQAPKVEGEDVARKSETIYENQSADRDGDIQLLISNELRNRILCATSAYRKHNAIVKREKALRIEAFETYQERSAKIDDTLNQYEQVRETLVNHATTMDDFAKMQEITTHAKRSRDMLNSIDVEMAALQRNDFVGGARVEASRAKILETAFQLIPMLQTAFNEKDDSDLLDELDIHAGSSSVIKPHLLEAIYGPDKDILAPDRSHPEKSQLIFDRKYLQRGQAIDEADASFGRSGVGDDSAVNEFYDEIKKAFDELQQTRRVVLEERHVGTDMGRNQAEIELRRAVLRARCWGLPVNREGFLPLPSLDDCDTSEQNGGSSDVRLIDDVLGDLIATDIDLESFKSEASASTAVTERVTHSAQDQVHDSPNPGSSSTYEDKQALQDVQAVTMTPSLQVRDHAELVRALRQARLLQIGEAKKRKVAELRVREVEKELKDIKRQKRGKLE